jgi:hypothetical protein
MTKIPAEGYYLLISAIGKIPDDIRLYQLSALDMALAEYRIIPFEFLNDSTNSPAMCIHPEWFNRFDEITGRIVKT